MPVAQYLGGVRRSLVLDERSLAARLGTYPHVIAALEAGNWALLPPWPETARIISGWMSLAGLDARPALAEAAVNIRDLQSAATAPGQRARPGFGSAHASQPSAAHMSGLAQAPVHGRAGSARGAPRVLQGALAGRYAGLDGVLDGADDSFDPADSDSAPSMTERVGVTISRISSGVASLFRRSVSRPAAVAARSRRHGAVWLVLVGAGAVLAGGTAATTVGAAAVSSLPPPARSALASITGYLSATLGNLSSDADDPRGRRSDKLISRP